MKANDFINLEPMKYWVTPKGKDYDKQVLRNPEKYLQFYFTPKMDGEWNKLIYTEDGEMMMLSRSKNVEGVYPDRAAKVPHIVQEMMNSLPKETILIGEFAFEDITKTSKDVGSIMRSLAPRAIKVQETGPKLHFYVFDCLMWAGDDVSARPYEQRFMNNAALKQFFNFTFDYVEKLEPKSVIELPQFLEDYFAIGGEGVVLIDKNQPYHFGKRPAWSSLKIKKQMEDFEARVVRPLEPNKFYEGKDADAWQYWDGDTPVTKPYYNGWKNGVECEYQGRIFSVTSGLTDEDREWLATSEARAAIDAGKLYAVCSGMELTDDAVRHPYLIRLRDDM